MKKKIVLYLIGIVAIALVLMFGLGLMVTSENNKSITENKIKQLTAVYVNNYSVDENFYKKLDSNVRITVISSDGTVIGDSHSSDYENMENHLSREEIKSALNGSPKTVTRYSDTLGVEMMYYAEKVQTTDGYVFVRVAIPVESTKAYVLRTIPLSLLILILSLSIAGVVGVLVCGELVKPLKLVENNLNKVLKGEYVPVMPSTGDNDLNKVVSDINDISEKIQTGMAEISSEKDRLDVIINSVSDGIVVFDVSGKIELINNKAKQIFNINDGIKKGVSYLTSDEKIINSVTQAVDSGKGQTFEFKSASCVYLLSCQKADSGYTILVLSDITAEINAEKNRSEFFANASHELKTPLTSIKGFNEMISLKSTDKAIIDYSAVIERESVRMLSLIDDMLKLSKLENTSELQREKIDIKSVAFEAFDCLSALAESKNVSLRVEGDGIVDAEREHIFMLIKNLVENGIRYNKDGGWVEVKITSDDKFSEITVSDSGMGMADEHKSRIFERFYRIDKSRSRETGGTGLGLSIVKHVAELYDAEIVLKSELGVGSTFAVKFNK